MRKLTDLLTLAAILAVPILLACTLPLLAVPSPMRAAADEGGGPPGKQVFLAAKCNLCHGIESQDIVATTKSDKMKGPDLSTVGTSHDPAFFAKFLRKEVPSAEGKTHAKGWTGTDGDLQTLANWLATLKK